MHAAEDAVEKGPKQSLEVVKSERLKFASGGTLRIVNSYGYLVVEGWEEPEIEITVIKSTDKFDLPANQAKAQARFDRVRLTAERKSDSEAVVSTNLPLRTSLFTSVTPSGEVVMTPPLRLPTSLLADRRLIREVIPADGLLSGLWCR